MSPRNRLGLRAVAALIADAWWAFITYRISPMSPTTARAVIQRNELRRPMR